MKQFCTLDAIYDTTSEAECQDAVSACEATIELADPVCGIAVEEFVDCEASVAEFEACTREGLRDYDAYLEGLSCQSAGNPPSLGDPKVCAELFERCPNLLASFD